MFEFFFMFTAMVVIITAVKFTGLLFGNSIDLPPFIWFENLVVRPDTFIIFYPSMIFQLYFWVGKLGIL